MTETDDTPPARGSGRPGFTTGACAAAAAKAATMGLLHGTIPPQIETLLPNGQTVLFTIAQASITAEHALAVVIKDGGSGPDVTHGAAIIATVSPLDGVADTVLLEAGEGVGHATRPGLELALGAPAINPVPFRNITANVRAIAAEWLSNAGLRVVISIPGGADLAKRTLNPRLGIVGGLSILGVSGIAYPYSSAAFKATVVQGVRAAALQGMKTVVLTTGGRTERFAMNHLPDLPPICFVQMGDFLASAMQAISNQPIPKVIVAAMAGKLVKIAEGRGNTHASKGRFAPSFLVNLAHRIGIANPDRLLDANTVRHAMELLEGEQTRFYQALVRTAQSSLRKRLPATTQVELMAFDFEGHLTAYTGDEEWTNPPVK